MTPQAKLVKLLATSGCAPGPNIQVPATFLWERALNQNKFKHENRPIPPPAPTGNVAIRRSRHRVLKVTHSVSQPNHVHQDSCLSSKSPLHGSGNEPHSSLRLTIN